MIKILFSPEDGIQHYVVVPNSVFSWTGFLRAKNETSLEHQVFQDEQQVCNLGHVRFAEELSDWLNVTVTDSFASAVCQLPQKYSQREYMDFLDSWGTVSKSERQTDRHTDREADRETQTQRDTDRQSDKEVGAVLLTGSAVFNM